MAEFDDLLRHVLEATDNLPLTLETARWLGGMLGTSLATWLFTRVLRRHRKQGQPPLETGFLTAQQVTELPVGEPLPPEPFSPALEKFLAALASPQASYAPRISQLTAPGVSVQFNAHGAAIKILVGEDQKPLEALLAGGLRGSEYQTACTAASGRLAAVIERDRQAANAEAAESLARALRQSEMGDLPPVAPAGTVLVSDGKNWVTEKDTVGLLRAQVRKSK